MPLPSSPPLPRRRRLPLIPAAVVVVVAAAAFRNSAETAGVASAFQPRPPLAFLPRRPGTGSGVVIAMSSSNNSDGSGSASGGSGGSASPPPAPAANSNSNANANAAPSPPRASANANANANAGISSSSSRSVNSQNHSHGAAAAAAAAAGAAADQHRHKPGDPSSDALAYNYVSSASVDISSASASNGLLSLLRTARDLDADGRRTFLYQIPLSAPCIPPPVELPDKVKLRKTSPTGGKVAVLVEETVVVVAAASGENNGGEKTKTRQALEIWTDDGHRLFHRIVLPESLHGKVCADDGWFGSLSWNPDETAVVYAAEVNPPKTRSFFDRDGEKKAAAAVAASKEGDGTGEQEAIAGGRHTLGLGKSEDWGEKYTGTSMLGLFVANLDTGEIGRVENVPGGPLDEKRRGKGKGGGDFSLGQAVFSPCGSNVVYVGWDAGGGGKMPRRLGSKHCHHRPCKLYASPVGVLLKNLSTTEESKKYKGHDGPFGVLTPDAALARSPRFCRPSAAGKSILAYLCNERGFDTHGGCMSLHVLGWDVNEEKALVDSSWELVAAVDIPERGETNTKVINMTFPGLFADVLPEECFTSDGKSILATSQWGSVKRVLKVSTEDGTVSPLNFDLLGDPTPRSDAFPSQSLLCLTEDGGAIVSQSEPNNPPLMGYIPADVLSGDAATDSRPIKSHLVAKLPPLSSSSYGRTSSRHAGRGFTYHVLNVRPPHGDVKVPVQCVLLLPAHASSERLPLIVVPHGGPHVAASTAYDPPYAYLASHGRYAVLHVNYRGSAGFGQAALESLAGTAGDLDVRDVVHATKFVTDKLGSAVDPDRVGICGGSHGGYLAGHCTGQYPELFKVAAMRNPVTNIASMVTATDIPDWCYVTTLGPGSYAWEEFRGPTKFELGKMWDASPVAHGESVEAPTLVAVGTDDRRVPPSQGLEWYHALKSRGVPVKLLVYEGEGHAIDGPASEADHWINVKRWFDEHL